MMPPNTQKGVSTFIGLVNYYRSMWENCSHMAAPLTNLTSIEVKFKWTGAEQIVYKEILHIVDSNNF